VTEQQAGSIAESDIEISLSELESLLDKNSGITG
jgi:hypothetical protein